MSVAIAAPVDSGEDSPNLREIAKALYMQGVPRTEIAARVRRTIHCIDSWRKRGDWRTTKQGIASTVAIVQNQPKPESYTLRPMLQDALKQIIPTCPTKLPKGSREQKATADTLLSLAQAAKLVEGWSDTNIAVLDIDLLSRDHREVVVNTHAGNLPAVLSDNPKESQSCGYSVAESEGTGQEKHSILPQDSATTQGGTPSLATPKIGTGSP